MRRRLTDAERWLRPGRYRSAEARNAAKALNDSAGENEDLLPTVIQLFELNGWRVYHVRDSRKDNYGYKVGDTTWGRTAKGFLDVIGLRAGRCVIAELKDEDGTLSPEQLIWFGLWEMVKRVCERAGIKSPIEIYVWRPRDVDRIMEILA